MVLTISASSRELNQMLILTNATVVFRQLGIESDVIPNFSTDPGVPLIRDTISES
jgi:hypothetical protein